MTTIKMTFAKAMAELKRPKVIDMLQKGMSFPPDTTDPDSPDMAELLKKGLARSVGRPRKKNPKKLIAIRVDPDIYGAAKRSPGYSGRVNDVMRGLFMADGLL